MLRTPVFTISAGGIDITSRFSGLNMTMTINDGEGLKSDTMEISLDDLDGMVEAPTTGAVLNPIGGYVETGTRDFGLFTVDNVTYEGWPQKINISAKSVAAMSLAKQREPKSYTKEEFPTYGDIFKSIASTIGLGLSIAGDLMGIPNPFEAQAEEGGLEFLTRLGEKINGAISVKSNNLVIVPKGAGLSASGSALQQIIIAPGRNLISYSVTTKDEPKYSEVESTYYDRAANERKVMTESTGMEGPKFLLRHPFQEEAEAQRAAQAAAKDLARSQAEATFVIEGDPFAQVEAHAVASGIRSKVDGIWRVKNASHTFTADAHYNTTLQCDVPS